MVGYGVRRRRSGNGVSGDKNAVSFGMARPDPRPLTAHRDNQMRQVGWHQDRAGTGGGRWHGD